MKKPKFEFYTRKDGHNEFMEFFDSLSVKDQQKLLSVIYKVQENGLLVAQQMKWVKKLDKNLFELRSEYGGNIQRAIYFHATQSRFIVTHGFIKKTQKTPQEKYAMPLKLGQSLRRRDRYGND